MKRRVLKLLLLTIAEWFEEIRLAFEYPALSPRTCRTAWQEWQLFALSLSVPYLSGTKIHMQSACHFHVWRLRRIAERRVKTLEETVGGERMG